MMMMMMMMIIIIIISETVFPLGTWFVSGIYV